jgi:hypothetical protein
MCVVCRYIHVLKSAAPAWIQVTAPKKQRRATSVREQKESKDATQQESGCDSGPAYAGTDDLSCA